MNKITQVKRYHIAKVYRRDQPSLARGRLREFHQCDFDIAGVYDPMIPDAEILRIISEVFGALGLDITIKMNHRWVLDGLFAVAGVPEEKFRTISSAVDKLDKMPWADVKKEMVEEKGLPEDVADRIGNYVKHSGSIEDMLKLLNEDTTFTANEKVKGGLNDIALLSSYLDALGVSKKVSFDLSLARGLDYYTGLIYEVICTTPASDSDKKKRRPNGPDQSTEVGSVAAGGRYDNLVGMYCKDTIPCVGISFGVERIFTILKARSQDAQKTREMDVYVMAFGGKGFDGLLPERLAITSQLWDAGIKAEFTAKVKPKLPQQFKAAAEVPIAIILGQDELAAGQVKIKLLGLSEGHPEKEGVLIAKTDVVAEVQKRLQQS
ncbi:Cytoplasmic and mitochondrial histidine tRNA synthetase [Agyrium rufum]|nr:Cytoplasmic and mitochondrial histidine tRNA synthetase [Agyrium rufum]